MQDREKIEHIFIDIRSKRNGCKLIPETSIKAGQSQTFGLG